MQRLFIFEGPDRCGKTEISKALADAMHVPYYKNEIERNAIVGHVTSKDYFVSLLRFGAPFLADFVRQTHASVVFDRNYPSEWVYSRLFDRDTDYAMLSRLDAAYAKMGTTIVLCQRESYVGIEDDVCKDIKQKQLERLDELYDEFAVWTNCRVLRVVVDDAKYSSEKDRTMLQVSDILKADVQYYGDKKIGGFVV